LYEKRRKCPEIGVFLDFIDVFSGPFPALHTRSVIRSNRIAATKESAPFMGAVFLSRQGSENGCNAPVRIRAVALRPRVAGEISLFSAQRCN
jgi:hypothetical protein